MKTLREYIAEAKQNKRAIGHFNISNLEGIWAVVNASRKLNVPVIVGVSEGERSFAGVKQMVAIIKSIREEFQIPLFLNADHTYSFEKVQEVVDAGYDAVIFDGAKLSMEENIQTMKRCVAYANEKNPNMLVEGELGYIGSSSFVRETVTGAGEMTSVEDALRYVQETRINMLAPAVGNLHGMRSDGTDPALDIPRIKAISDAVGIPLVLHGASGNTVEDVQKAIQAGVAIVHINTELRVTYQKGLVLSLQEMPDEIAPYKYLKGPMSAMQKVAEEKLRIFNFL